MTKMTLASLKNSHLNGHAKLGQQPAEAESPFASPHCAVYTERSGYASWGDDGERELRRQRRAHQDLLPPPRIRLLGVPPIQFDVIDVVVGIHFRLQHPRKQLTTPSRRIWPPPRPLPKSRLYTMFP